MKVSKQQLAIMSNDELQEVANMVASIVLSRKNRRREELWSNVVTAITKYQEEMNEQIDIIGKGDRLVPYPGQGIIGALETV